MMPTRKKRRGRVYKARKTGPASCAECRARLVFVTMLATGKKVPVDPIPNDEGTVCARLVASHLQGYVISKDRPYERIYTRYTTHFSTCADRSRPVLKPEAEPVPTLFEVD